MCTILLNVKKNNAGLAHIHIMQNNTQLEMWPNAQRDIGSALYSTQESLVDADYYMLRSNGAKMRN